MDNIFNKIHDSEKTAIPSGHINSSKELRFLVNEVGGVVILGIGYKFFIVTEYKHITIQIARIKKDAKIFVTFVKVGMRAKNCKFALVESWTCFWMLCSSPNG